MWKECGYLSLTKDGKKVTVMVKHVRYVANFYVDLRLITFLNQTLGLPLLEYINSEFHLT
jgi:hypothetical protein